VPNGIFSVRAMRFFFDYTSDGKTLLDYKGQEFRASEPAIDYGKAIADLLRHELNETWRGWTIAIRDVQGKTVSLLPISGRELHAA
jgi:hypothetical protein